jgi:hypothetical protein
MEEFENIFFQQFGGRRNLPKEAQKLTHIFHSPFYFTVRLANQGIAL